MLQLPQRLQRPRLRSSVRACSYDFFPWLVWGNWEDGGGLACFSEERTVLPCFIKGHTLYQKMQMS